MKAKIKRKDNTINHQKLLKKERVPLLNHCLSSPSILGLTNKKKKQQKNIMISNSDKEYSLMRDLLNRVLNIQVNSDISYDLLKRRIDVALKPHLQVTCQSIKVLDEIGVKALTNGKLIIKCCSIMQQNPSFNFKRLISNLNKKIIKQLCLYVQQFKQYYFMLVQKYDNQEKQNLPKPLQKNKSHQKIQVKTSNKYSLKHSNTCHLRVKSEIIELNRERIFQQQTQQLSINQSLISNNYFILESKPDLFQQFSFLKTMSFSTISSQYSNSTNQIKRKMESILQNCIFMSLSNISIIGIIQTNYKRKGQYAIVLCRSKNIQISQEVLCVFPIQNKLNYQLLKQIKIDYPMLQGWIQNQDKVDIGEFWERNLEQIMPYCY